MTEDPQQGMEQQKDAADQQEQDLTIDEQQAEDVKGGAGFSKPVAAPYEEEL